MTRDERAAAAVWPEACRPHRLWPLLFWANAESGMGNDKVALVKKIQRTHMYAQAVMLKLSKSNVALSPSLSKYSVDTMRPCPEEICVCRGACNLGTSTIECIKSGGHDLDVVPTTPCMLRRALRPVSSRGVLVPKRPAAARPAPAPAPPAPTPPLAHTDRLASRRPLPAPSRARGRRRRHSCKVRNGLGLGLGKGLG